MEPASKTIKRRGPLGWIDRRLVRSALYGLVLFILFLLFKTTEWLIDHYLSASKNHGLIAALSVAIGLAIVFQTVSQAHRACGRRLAASRPA